MNSRKNVLGVILARAGSRGLEGKHLRPLLGREVIQWTFDHAQASTSLSRVVVSTDCPVVRKLAHERGFTTIARPAELAGDEATVQDALLHALVEVESRGGDAFRADAVACLYGNVPARPDGITDACVAKLFDADCDSVRTFTPVGKWHPQWMSELDESGNVTALGAEGVDRRQNLQPLYLHDGGGLVMTRASLERGLANRSNPHAMFGADRRGIKVEPGSAVEVDTPRDLDIAEAALRSRGLGKPTMRMAA